MGRLRTKDHDLAPGWQRKNGRLYYQPTKQAERERGRFSIPDGPMVYFIRGKGGAIKIGFTASKSGLQQRMSMLRVASPVPLYLMGAVPGSREDERRAHEALRLHRGIRRVVRASSSRDRLRA